MKNYTKTRAWLKSIGWRRRDRANQERWLPPWDGVGYQPLSVSYASAVRRQKKLDAKLETKSNA